MSKKELSTYVNVTVTVWGNDNKKCAPSCKFFRPMLHSDYCNLFCKYLAKIKRCKACLRVFKGAE